MLKEWCSVEEASELLGVSKQTVRDNLSTKKIKGNKVGREWRIPKTELDLALGIERKDDKKDMYIRELEEEIKYLRLQNETFKNIAGSLIKVISWLGDGQDEINI